MKDYPAELKLEAVRLFYEEGKTQVQVTASLGIRDPRCIQKWLRQYRAEGPSAFAKTRGRPREKEGEQAELERLRMEVALLKKFHSELPKVQLAQRNIGCSNHRNDFEMKAMCAFLGVSRAAYYTWVKKLEKPDADTVRLELVQQAYRASHQIYGYRRISLWLRRKQGLVINPKAVLRLMHKLNIRSRARKRKMYRKLEELGI